MVAELRAAPRAAAETPGRGFDSAQPGATGRRPLNRGHAGRDFDEPVVRRSRAAHSGWPGQGEHRVRLRILTSLAAGAAAVLALGLAAPIPPSAAPEPGRRLAVPQQAAHLADRQDHRPRPRRDAHRRQPRRDRRRHDEDRDVPQDRRGRRPRHQEPDPVAAHPGRREVRRGRRPADPLLPGDLQQGDPRPRGDPDADRRRRQPADRQGRLGRGHRLRCRPDAPVLQGGRRQQRRRRQPEDAVRPDRERCARSRRCRTTSTPTRCRSVATARTSTASSPVARRPCSAARSSRAPPPAPSWSRSPPAPASSSSVPTRP